MAHLTLDYLAGAAYPLLVQLSHYHDLRGGANGRQRIAQLMRQHGQELVFATVGHLHRFLSVTQGLLYHALVGDVARDTGHRLHFAVGTYQWRENIIVNTATELTVKRHLPTQRLFSELDLLDLAFVHLGMPGLVAQFPQVLAYGFVPVTSIHLQQPVVDIAKAPVKVEHIDKVRHGGEYGFVELTTRFTFSECLGLLLMGQRQRQQVGLMLQLAQLAVVNIQASAAVALKIAIRCMLRHALL